MASKYRDLAYKENAYVLCPFYRKTGRNGMTIKCEGLLGTHCVHVFRTKAEAAGYLSDFCEGLYKNCLYYGAMMDKWDLDHGGK